MKRCPTCNRVESDAALKFCRVDGATLVSEPPGFGGEADTAQLGPASEVHTSILPHRTDANINRATAQTTVLPQQAAHHPTREFRRPKSRRSVILTIALIAAVFAAVIVGGYFYFFRKSSMAIQSIAVLPFENRSGTTDTDYLSDGLADSLIYRLSQLPNLKVSPTSSVMRYKGKSTEIAQIAKELQADAVMSGRLMQQGDNLSISVQLIDARTNKLIWAEQYERKMSDLLATQREIAASIAQKLQLKLAGDEKGITKKYTNSNEAYQSYLRGRFYWNKRNAEALKKSIDYFNQAIEQDPNFALAYAGLADSYNLLPYYSAASPEQSIPKGKAAARKALEIDESLAEAHTALGYQLCVYDWNFAESGKEFQRAIELNPNYPTAHQWYGSRALVTLGRSDEGIAELKQAAQMDPLSLIINSDLGEAYANARQYDQAIEQLRRTIEMDPNFYNAHWRLGKAYEAKGAVQDALAEYQKARQLNDDPLVLASLGHLLGSSGKRDQAMKTLDQLQQMAKERYVSSYSFAIVYEGLGDKDRAFQWLEKGYQERVFEMNYLKVDPLLEGLRADPRFGDLVRRVGLP
jgi:TolB-like protein/Flp pilus assembly protein TadD